MSCMSFASGLRKEHDHEKLRDFIEQINDLLDEKHRESGTEGDEKREVAPALTIFFGSHRDRWPREWLEYQPLVHCLGVLSPVHRRFRVFPFLFSYCGFEGWADGGGTG